MKTLTTQEKKVAKYIANGYVGKQIANELCVSTHTIHTHTRNIRRKWQANNIADITRKYILALDDPKKVLLSLMFLTIQVKTILNDGVADDAIRVKTMRVKQARKTKNKRKNDSTFILED